MHVYVPQHQRNLMSSATMVDRDLNGEEQDELEVGCLSIQVIAARNIKLPGGGGYMDMLLNNQQPDPYCRITLGVS